MAELNPTAPADGRPCDGNAVRVRLGPASRLGDEPALRIGCEAEPLRMGNPTIGTGPLGGVAMAPDPEEPATVRTQRQVLVDDVPTDVDLRSLGSGRHVLRDGASSTRVVLEPGTTDAGGVVTREVIVDGFRFLVEVEAERVAALRARATRARSSGAHAGPLQVKAIIPGKVVGVSVVAGDAVTAGQQLLVVEAMKMQNELRAPRDGTIERVGVAVGATIEIGDLLVVIS